MDNLAAQRERMVATQIERRGVRDPNVLSAMRVVPRERFVPERLVDNAYDDTALPIDAGQTISQPYVVALMIEAAGIAPGQSVLEVGTGSGYAAAVMSLIADRVYSIERHSRLAGSAARRLQRLGFANVEIRAADGSRGWPEAAPFDAIVLAAGGPEIPLALKRQLAVGGRLIMPVGATARSQRLVKMTRVKGDVFVEEGLGDVKFVPLIGEYGWGADEITRGKGLR